MGNDLENDEVNEGDEDEEVDKGVNVTVFVNVVSCALKRLNHEMQHYKPVICDNS